MIREVDGRLVVHCNNCPVRLDLGPATTARSRNRAPSGWVSAGGEIHFCPMCASRVSLAKLAAAHAEPGPQPLV